MHFDRIARYYDWMETVAAGRLMQQARTQWLADLDGRRRVLSAGEGHGRFATAFARRYPEARLTCVDESPAMLARARRRADRAQVSADWITATIPDWQPPAHSFDAIVTCFFLDCFPPPQLRPLIAALARGATDTAIWLVVYFAVPSGRLPGLRARAIHAALYAFFRRTAALPARRLTPPDDLLRTAGFSLVRRREFSWGLVRADLWQRTA